MKNFYAILISALLLFSLAACGSQNESKSSESSDVPSSSDSTSEPESSDSSPEPESSDSQQIPNPFADCDTLDDAAKLAGFTLELPEALDAKGERTIQAIENELISVLYSGEGDAEVLVRKGAGEEDVSGDYNTYENETTAEVDGAVVTLRGNGELVNLATWVRDGHAFSLYISAGAEAQEFTDLIAGIK